MVSSKTCYLKQSFLHNSQTPLSKNTMIFFNIMVLPQNFKNTLFSNTYKYFYFAKLISA
jgi:hypothetical protein